MTELVTLYCVMFFVIECLKNARRAQRIIARTYVGDLDDKLAQASWMMILVGLVLTFTSSPIFLPCVLFVKMGAGMVIEYFNHRNDIRPQMQQMGNTDQPLKIIFPKEYQITNQIKQIGGPNASNSRH